MNEKPKKYVHNIPAARRLRGAMTSTEESLWDCLRDRRFMGLKFRRQHAIKRYVVDFYCSELRLIVEIDGGVHDDPERTHLDAERQSYLQSLGYRFIRVRTDDIASDLTDVLERLKVAVRDIQLPSPAQSGEGSGVRA